MCFVTQERPALAAHRPRPRSPAPGQRGEASANAERHGRLRRQRWAHLHRHRAGLVARGASPATGDRRVSGYARTPAFLAGAGASFQRRALVQTARRSRLLRRRTRRPGHGSGWAPVLANTRAGSFRRWTLVFQPCGTPRGRRRRFPARFRTRSQDAAVEGSAMQADGKVSARTSLGLSAVRKLSAPRRNFGSG